MDWSLTLALLCTVCGGVAGAYSIRETLRRTHHETHIHTTAAQAYQSVGYFVEDDTSLDAAPREVHHAHRAAPARGVALHEHDTHTSQSDLHSD